jgi:molybdate transport system substrate-binding protein
MMLCRFTLVCALLLAAPARGETISVAVAISLKGAMEEIGGAYEEKSGDEVRFTFGSSGQLMAQIRNGAPVDAFVSAAGKQVDELTEAGQLGKDGRREIAGNALVLIVPADAGDGAPASFTDLADARHRRVAVGEPKTVPAGLYAMQVLTRLGVARTLADDRRLVYGANVRQVLDYVVRGEVAAGVVYATDAREAGADAVRVVATADAGTHDPIVYPAAVVTASRKREAAGRFLEFLQGEEARRILKARGFTIPGDDANAGKKDPRDENPAEDAGPRDQNRPPADQEPAAPEPAGGR